MQSGLTDVFVNGHFHSSFRKDNGVQVSIQLAPGENTIKWLPQVNPTIASAGYYTDGAMFVTRSNFSLTSLYTKPILQKVFSLP